MGLSKGPVRIRSERYLKYIRSHPCMICGDYSEAHHLTFAQPRAKALKTGDQYTVPLCHRHHMELHDDPMSEKTWWAVQGIKPIVWAEDKYEKWSRNNANTDSSE